MRGQREKVIDKERCGALVTKGCVMGHKLDLWSSIYEGPKTDFYQDEH
jgi:hypothetical protein